VGASYLLLHRNALDVPQKLGDTDHESHDHADDQHHEQSTHRIHVELSIIDGRDIRVAGALIAVEPLVSQLEELTPLAEPQDSHAEIGTKVSVCLEKFEEN